MYFFLVGDKEGPKTSNVLVDCEVHEMSLKDESVASDVMKMGSVCEVYNNENNNSHEKEALSVCFEESGTPAKEKAMNVTLDENERNQPTNTSKARKKKQKKASKATNSTLTTIKVVDSKSQKEDDDTSLEGTYHINVTTFFNLSVEIYKILYGGRFWT